MTRRHPGRLLAVFLGFLAVCSFHPAANGEVDPADVYQVVERVNAELATLLGVASIAESGTDAAAPPLTARQPRHVVQKAREVLLKVQALRALNGLPENPVPPFPTAEATPADSKRMVDAVYRDIRELRTKVNLNGAAPTPPRRPGQTPTDVYAALQRASDTLDHLGVPRTMPNDVFRVAVMIVKDLETIAAARGRPLPAFTPAAPCASCLARDSYTKTYEVLERLKVKLEAEPVLMVKGGIVLPNRRPPPLTPAHALDLENNLLAELGSIKAALGIASPTVVPPLVHGKTPADTVGLLDHALALVEAL